MSIQLLRIYKGIRNSLFSQMNKQFLIFLFFLMLSGVFWLMMTLNETTEQEVCIPVRLVGTPKNCVITTEISDTLKVTMRDKGYTIAAYLYGDRISPIQIQFANYANRQKGHGTISQADLQKLVYQKLSQSTKITAIKPDRLEFYFNYGKSKEVPVRLAGSVVPDKSFYLARTRFTPDKVTIYASKRLLDSISYVSTQHLRIVNFNDTVVRDIDMEKIKGVKIVPSRVTVTLYPDILTEETVEVPIRAINMPEGKVLRTFPSRVKVRFTVGASMFRRVKPEQFIVAADYNDMAANPAPKCKLTLRAVPHSVRNAKLDMQTVDYIIEQQ